MRDDAVMMGAAAIQPVVAARSEITLTALQRGLRERGHTLLGRAHPRHHFVTLGPGFRQAARELPQPSLPLLPILPRVFQPLAVLSDLGPDAAQLRARARLGPLELLDL